MYDAAMGVMREQGYLVEKEGALWFASTELGEDKDNVVIRSTGGQRTSRRTSRTTTTSSWCGSSTA